VIFVMLSKDRIIEIFQPLQWSLCPRGATTGAGFTIRARARSMRCWRYRDQNLC